MNEAFSCLISFTFVSLPKGPPFNFITYFLKYPLLVENREEFKKKAEKNRIILGEWFEAPVYPYSGSLKLWGVDEKDIPVAMYVSKHVVNLPTDIEEVNKVIDFLKRELLLIKDEE